MNDMSDLDDPLGSPSIDPTAVRQRAEVLRRGRMGRRMAGTAGVVGGVMALALVVSLTRPRTVQIEVGSEADSEQPAAVPTTECVPGTRVTRSFIVMAGNTPEVNDTLIGVLMEVLNDEDFAMDLNKGLDADLAARFPVEAIRAALSVSRATGSPVIEVDVTAPTEVDANEISQAVSPTLRAIVEPDLGRFQVPSHLPGPFMQELFAEPNVTQVSC